MKRGRGAVLWARLSLQRRDGSRSLALVGCSAVGAGCALAKRRRLLPPKAQTGRPQDPPVEAQRKARTERKQSAEEAAGSPRSLQFALCGVSSADTSRVLHALRGLPLELRHLNRTGADGASSCGVRTAARVFGWHNWLLQEDARRSSRVIWKSAKAMEGASIQRLARKLWGTEDDQDVDVLCTISGVARVVRSADRAYAVRDRCQVWVECLFDFGHQICIAKKELRQFGDYRVQDMAMSECQGFLVRPTVTRIRNEMIAGSMLQCLRAVDPRSEQAPSDLVDRIMSDLPRFTLQWEDAFVNDLFPPMPLFDQAFDW